MPLPEKCDDFGKLFFDWLSESVGISRDLIRSLDQDNDWAFVIKMHAILEVGLNHLLITHFGNPGLPECHFQA